MKKFRSIVVTSRDRCPRKNKVLTKPLHVTGWRGRLPLTTLVIVLSLLFLTGSLPLTTAASGRDRRDYVTYVTVNELSGTVVDNETGAPVDNVIIVGEIHSRVLYFWVKFNRDEYSYRIWDGGDETLRSGQNVETIGGRFVLPISDLLGDNEEHWFQIEVSADGYATTRMEGTFHAYEDKSLRIKLTKLEDLSSFDLKLNPSEGIIMQSRIVDVKQVEKEDKWPESKWVLWNSSEGKAKRAKIRKGDREPLSRTRSESIRDGWKYWFTTYLSAKASNYRNTGYRVESGRKSHEIVIGHMVDKHRARKDLTYDTTKSWSNVSKGIYNSWPRGWRGPYGDYKYYYYKGSYNKFVGYRVRTGETHCQWLKRKWSPYTYKTHNTGTETYKWHGKDLTSHPIGWSKGWYTGWFNDHFYYISSRTKRYETYYYVGYHLYKRNIKWKCVAQNIQVTISEYGDYDTKPSNSSAGNICLPNQFFREFMNRRGTGGSRLIKRD